MNPPATGAASSRKTSRTELTTLGWISESHFAIRHLDQKYGLRPKRIFAANRYSVTRETFLDDTPQNNSQKGLKSAHSYSEYGLHEKAHERRAEAPMYPQATLSNPRRRLGRRASGRCGTISHRLSLRALPSMAPHLALSWSLLDQSPGSKQKLKTINIINAWQEQRVCRRL